MTDSPARPPLASAKPRAVPAMSSPAGVESRVVDAWCEWLGALATDAEAALSAAMAYKALDDRARDSWLQALEEDAPRLTVPPIAVYAPLLAVETSRSRRARIMAAIGPDDSGQPRTTPRGLWGLTDDGLRVAVVVHPLYLDFVQVLACGYQPSEGFEWVRHDPIVDRRDAPEGGAQIEGATVESTPLKALIDDLAMTVLSHTRHGRRLPEALRVFADLFGPRDA